MKGMMWLSVFAAFAAVACSAATDGPGTSEPASTGAQDLGGGCREVCPKCPPNQICPLIACYLDCHPKQKCVQNAFCIQGYQWSSARCSCVPIPGHPSCTTDADCYAYSDYCSGGCNCEALGTNDPVPQSCPDPVNCFADPCMGVTAVCLNGTCSLQ
jgi:hypothetical protein